MRVRKAAAEEEDMTGLAGWMYTDLLLALMVVFLATISFVPTINGRTPKVETSLTDMTSLRYQNPLSAVYQEFDGTQLLADIKEFKKSRGLDPDSVISNIKYVAGYDPVTEDSAIALKRASQFSAAFDGFDKALTSDAETSLESSKSVPACKIQISLKFAPPAK